MTAQPLVALDIGSTKVTCAIGLPAPARSASQSEVAGSQAGLPHDHSPGFELLGSSVISYPTLSETWLGDPLMVGRTIEQALEATGVSGDFHRALVAFSHPLLASEQVTASVTLADEPVTIRERDMDRLTAKALDHTLSIDREPLVVERLACAGNGFHGVQDPLGLMATRLQGTFHIVTVPMAARRAIVQAVEFSGLDVAQVTFSLLAITAVATADSDASRALLVDFGGLHTDVGLLVNGRLVSLQTLPWGGLNFAMEVARSARVTLEQAMALSLEGLSSRRPDVRQLLERELPKLQRTIQHVLKGQPLPDVAWVSGRGALIDGLVEWIEQVTGVKTAVVRSPRTQAMTELARQLGVSVTLGLLQHATSRSDGFDARTPRFVDRVIGRTRALLIEYF